VVETDAEEGITPRQPRVAIPGTAMFAGFEILLAALAHGETAAREGDVDGVSEPGGGKSQDVCIFFLLGHVMGEHGGRWI